MRAEPATLRRGGRRAPFSRLLLVIAVLAAAHLALAPAAPAKGTTVRTSTGDLAELVDGFVAGIPRRGSGGYDVPTASEAERMADAFSRLAAGDAAGAASLAGPLSYEVVRYTDVGTGRAVHLLQEKRTKSGAFPHAWGLYGVVVGATSPLLVEVTHPLADLETERQGVAAFRRGAGARALFVAGAHRDANPDGVADVAHSTGSVFHAIHTRAAAAGTRVYQPHGYGESTYSEYDAVVSNGDVPTALTSAVGDALDASGLRTCVFDGVETCAKLAARSNVQGQQTRAAGGEFLHVETVTSVRQDPARRTEVAHIVADLAGS